MPNLSTLWCVKCSNVHTNVTYDIVCNSSKAILVPHLCNPTILCVMYIMKALLVPLLSNPINCHGTPSVKCNNTVSVCVWCVMCDMHPSMPWYTISVWDVWFIPRLILVTFKSGLINRSHFILNWMWYEGGIRQDIGRVAVCHLGFKATGNVPWQQTLGWLSYHQTTHQSDHTLIAFHYQGITHLHYIFTVINIDIGNSFFQSGNIFLQNRQSILSPHQLL